MTSLSQALLGVCNAFPGTDGKGEESWSGMTYRQWLIGVALSGAMAAGHTESPEELSDLSDRIIAQVDNLLEKMGEEYCISIIQNPES